MITKYEYAQSMATAMHRNLTPEKLKKMGFTGRIIAIGNDRERFGDEGDPTTHTEISLELTRRTRLMLRLKVWGFYTDSNSPWVNTDQGNRAMSTREVAKITLHNNRWHVKRKARIFSPQI